MAGYKYSLAKVKIAMSVPTEDNQNPITFGGQGSMIGSITISRKSERFSAEGDATGGFVVNENLDKTGTCVLSIKQFAPLVNTLTNIFNAYDDASVELENGIDMDAQSQAISIKVFYEGALLAECNFCFLNMPELPFEEENGTRDFSFECGEVNLELKDYASLVSKGIILK